MGDVMSAIYIERWYHSDCTLGRLYYGDYQCWTLELPKLGNRSNISCIPAGHYQAFKRNSPSNGRCIELRDVPGRSFIQIHAGNFTRQIEGCILPGNSITHLDADGIPDVGSSRAALDKLLALTPDELCLVISD